VTDRQSDRQTNKQTNTQIDRRNASMHKVPSLRKWLNKSPFLIDDWQQYDTIRYDSGYLTCSKKLTGSQLSLPHGINKKLKCETKNKMMSVIDSVQSHYREAVQ